jgi:hypothetical protein
MAEVDWLNAGISLCSAGIGAWAAIASTKRSLEHSLAMARQESKEQEKALILSLRDEMAILAERFKSGVGSHLDKLEAGEPFERFFPVDLDYFTIYRSNGALIGRIENNELRKAIIQAYTRVMGVVDSFRYNNRLISALEAAQKEQIASATINFRLIAGDRRRQLTDYAPILKSAVADAETHVENMMKKIAEFEAKK